MNPEASIRDYETGVSGSGSAPSPAAVQHHTLSVNSQEAVDSRGLVVVGVDRPAVNGPASTRVGRLCDYGVRPLRR